MRKLNEDRFDDNIWQKNDKGLFLPNIIINEQIDNSKKKKKTIKNYIEWAFKNLSIVLLAPSFLGAVWQILELSSMNIAYIRFFSISQIPVDGTLILFLLIFLIGLSKMTVSFIRFVLDSKLEMLKDENLLQKIRPNLKRRIIIQVIIIFILLMPIIVYFIPSIFINMFPTSPIVAICLIYFSITGIIFYLAEFILLVSIKIVDNQPNGNSINEYIRDFIQTHRNPIYWSVLLSIGIIIFTLILLLKLFSQNFILPSDLYNTKNLETIIYNEFKTKDYSVEYFNDKYIFVKLCTIEKCSRILDREIVIYPTEKVLFKTTYGKVWTGYFTTSEPVNN